MLKFWLWFFGFIPRAMANRKRDSSSKPATRSLTISHDDLEVCMLAFRSHTCIEASTREGIFLPVLNGNEVSREGIFLPALNGSKVSRFWRLYIFTIEST
ncbi:hypothetical protein MUK42_33166 [Musa troglodytarum]|uniref:Secreted protein n=1 Tax=Musa troglodytarum TaxID=320322 RepID=A0A9E7K4U5_9LILI|nr:hypothetical protein MUK42_33166 [Musa troglodytarum]